MPMQKVTMTIESFIPTVEQSHKEITKLLAYLKRHNFIAYDLNNIAVQQEQRESGVEGGANVNV